MFDLDRQDSARQPLGDDAIGRELESNFRVGLDEFVLFAGIVQLGQDVAPQVGGVPLATDLLGFWIVVAIVITFTALAGALVLRRRRK